MTLAAADKPESASSPDEPIETMAAVDRGLADIEAGRTVAWAEVKRWMQSWGTERELPRPRSE